MQVVLVEDHFQVQNLKMSLNHLVTQLNSLITGFNILVKMIKSEDFNTNIRFKSYSKEIYLSLPIKSSDDKKII